MKTKTHVLKLRRAMIDTNPSYPVSKGATFPVLKIGFSNRKNNDIILPFSLKVTERINLVVNVTL